MNCRKVLNADQAKKLFRNAKDVEVLSEKKTLTLAERDRDSNPGSIIARMDDGMYVVLREVK